MKSYIIKIFLVFFIFTAPTYCMKNQNDDQQDTDPYRIFIDKTFVMPTLKVINNITKKDYSIDFKNHIFKNNIIIQLPYFLTISRDASRAPYNTYLCIWDIRDIDKDRSNIAYFFSSFFNNKPKVQIKCKKKDEETLWSPKTKRAKDIQKILKKYKKRIPMQIFNELLNKEEPLYYTKKQCFTYNKQCKKQNM